MYQPYMDLIWILRIYSSYQSHGVSSMHIYFWIHSPTIRSEVPWRVSESLGLAAWQLEGVFWGVGFLMINLENHHVPKKGTILVGNTSSNHWFSGDMLVGNTSSLGINRHICQIMIWEVKNHRNETPKYWGGPPTYLFLSFGERSDP